MEIGEWNLNDVFRASHGEHGAEDEDSDFTLEIKQSANSLILAVTEQLNDDDLYEDKEAVRRAMVVVSNWQERLHSLPFFSQLHWGTGELSGNCDATTDVLYCKDMKDGVVWGAFVLKMW